MHQKLTQNEKYAKKTITNAQNPKATKPNCFSKAKKPIVKAIPNALTEAVKQIAKTVH